MSVSIPDLEARSKGFKIACNVHIPEDKLESFQKNGPHPYLRPCPKHEWQWTYKCYCLKCAHLKEVVHE